MIVESLSNGKIQIDITEESPSISIYTDCPVVTEQIQSDWNQTNSALLDYIKNKPDLTVYETIAGAASKYELIGVASGLMTSHLSAFNHDNIALGATAYGWGNHASAGYELQSNKGQPSGYVPLTAESKIDLAYLPNTVIERLVKVADQAARFALTTATVQNGDSVKQMDTEMFYYVSNDTKLDSEDGYDEYNAGIAGAVEYSNVLNKPANLTSLAGLSFASTSFVKMTGANTFALDTNVYLTAESDTLATVTGRAASSATAISLTGGLTLGGGFDLAHGLNFGDGDTGIYESADDEITIKINNSVRFIYGISLLDSKVTIRTAGGALQSETPSNNNPTLLPAYNDDNTGIGTAAADQLSLIAGGVEGIRIRENTTIEVGIAGNVYIGDTTTTTSYKLDVNGTFICRTTAYAVSGFVGNSLTSYNTNSDLTLNANGTGDVVLQSGGGKVGIGTTSPSSLLHIDANDATVYDASVSDGQEACGATLSIQNDDGTTGSFAQINFQTSEVSGRATARIVAIDTGADNNDLAFVTEGSGTPSEKMRIQANGNVGIGTTTPTAYLHIKAGTAAAGTAPLKLTSGTNLTTPENGAFEFDGTNLYFTVGGVRKTVTLT